MAPDVNEKAVISYDAHAHEPMLNSTGEWLTSGVPAQLADTYDLFDSDRVLRLPVGVDSAGLNPGPDLRDRNMLTLPAIAQITFASPPHGLPSSCSR